MADSKISLKIGLMEFSGEGDQIWLTQQLDKIIEKVPDFLQTKPETKTNIHNKITETGNSDLGSLSILNIVGKIGAKTPAELIIAGSAYIHFILGKAAFSRDEINSNIKNATGTYKQTISGNLTKLLASLEKSGDLLKSGNYYSLSSNKVSELNAILSK